jgi:hypothetical protein
VGSSAGRPNYESQLSSLLGTQRQLKEARQDLMEEVSHLPPPTTNHDTGVQEVLVDEVTFDWIQLRYKQIVDGADVEMRLIDTLFCFAETFKLEVDRHLRTELEEQRDRCLVAGLIGSTTILGMDAAMAGMSVETYMEWRTRYP